MGVVGTVASAGETIRYSMPMNGNSPILEKCIFLANVGCHLLPLAFGADPASAGCVTKVPQAWELGAQLCSGYFSFFRGSTIDPSGNMRTEPGNEASLELKPIVKNHLSASEATAPVLSAR